MRSQLGRLRLFNNDGIDSTLVLILECYCGNKFETELAEKQPRGSNEQWYKCPLCGVYVLSFGSKRYFWNEIAEESGTIYSLWSTDPSETLLDTVNSLHRHFGTRPPSKGAAPKKFKGPTGTFVVDPRTEEKFRSLKEARIREREASRDK